MLLHSVNSKANLVKLLKPKTTCMSVFKPKLCIQIKSMGPKTNNYVDNLNSIQQQKPYTDGLIC